MTAVQLLRVLEIERNKKEIIDICLNGCEIDELIMELQALLRDSAILTNVVQFTAKMRNDLMKELLG